jgi:hypothetical protein
MKHRTLVLISVLLTTTPGLSSPAEAQFPRRMLGPLRAPLGMMLQILPRPHHRHRLHRSPRAAHPAPSGPRQAPATERADRGRPVVAASALAFWPIAAPDAFEDMIGYALWPREYARQFWSHGPRDVIQAMTAPTAAYASADGTGGRLPSLVGAAHAGEGERAICVARVTENAVRPLNRITETIDLNAAQRQKLHRLRTAVRTAIAAETAACRSDIPPTQPDRLRAMIDGLWAMSYAEFRIRPALAAFHDSLDDTQKAQLADPPQTVGSRTSTPDATPAAICSEALAVGNNPFTSVARALRPTTEQQESLHRLYGASMEMGKFLTSTCPAESAASPVERLDAANDRVMALLHAAMNIEPILGDFYSTLSERQRQRFNTAIH